jgi:hypothetical protein
MRIAPPQVSQTRTSVANTRFRREAQSRRRREAEQGGAVAAPAGTICADTTRAFSQNDDLASVAASG